MDLSAVKNRFGIIGNDSSLNNAIETAIRVAQTDLTVLVHGESGVGKESIPKIIHDNSARKHSKYVAINCGAIPEGTIESELFGHEKGAFTGASESRKGYFEEADGGTIFLDEVGDLPLSTQVRLLRVLETGEFIRVGSSKTQKTNVRVIAASNVDFPKAIRDGRFRMDLYYRLSTVPITVPPLRERQGDIHLLFNKFALDCADRYKMPSVRLTPEARALLETFYWPGNIRQLKNVAEQISIMEDVRSITAETLRKYIPIAEAHNLPVYSGHSSGEGAGPDREIILKMIMQLRDELNELKDTVDAMLHSGHRTALLPEHILPAGREQEDAAFPEPDYIIDTQPVSDEEKVKSVEEMESEMIMKALQRHGGKRKPAAMDLGISERTLYRKIKELGME